MVGTRDWHWQSGGYCVKGKNLKMFRVASELRNHSPTKEITSTFRAKLIIFLSVNLRYVKSQSSMCQKMYAPQTQAGVIWEKNKTNRKELWWWKSKKETIDGPGARSLWALYLRELYYTFVTPTKIRINVCNAHLPRSLSGLSDRLQFWSTWLQQVYDKGPDIRSAHQNILIST